MLEFLWSWWVHTWAITVEAAPWLLGGFWVAGLIHAWVPVGRIATHLGRSSFGGVLKAALLGVPLPLCSCSVIPVAASIRRSGASKGATASFLISTPETGVDSISITYALLGPVMAVLRPAAALLSALTAGVLINRFAPEVAPAARTADERGGAALFGGNCGCDCSCGMEASSVAPVAVENEADTQTSRCAGFVRRVVAALRYGFLDMFADLALWLIIGLVLAGLISALVPETFLDRTIGSGWLAMVVVLAVALPFYVCATSSTPIAAALVAKGLSPGTALVFLLVGPATNVATMIVVAKELGRRSLLIYLVSIAAVALGLGVLVDRVLVLPALEALQVGFDVDEPCTGGAAVLGAVFAALLLNGVRLRYFPRQPAA